MDIIKKTFAGIFAILFIITAIAALFLFNFDRNAFTAETYQKAFTNGNFYDELPAIMAETIPPLRTHYGPTTTAWLKPGMAWRAGF